MSARVLTVRELNRATLARQLLLDRVQLPAEAALERLVGLQAQQPRSPYIALWTRLRGFSRDDLAYLIADRTAVKATLQRGTLHLVTAADYLLLRPTIKPVLTRASEAMTRQRGATFDEPALLEAARRFIAERPRTFAEISALLTELNPEADLGAMRFAVRMRLPLVQVPVERGWSYPGNPSFTLAEEWLGRQLPAEGHLDAVITRYLAAFGPASVSDIQTWSGLSQLKPAVERLRPELIVYHDERGRELFDLPDMPLPDADTPAPERFLPEFDNLLLSHQDRTRVVADAHRPGVFLPGLRVGGTFLVDGFIAGSYVIERAKASATLAITPFVALSPSSRARLVEEGDALLRFVEPEAREFAIQWAD